jgi:hypothetical protein
MHAHAPIHFNGPTRVRVSVISSPAYAREHTVSVTSMITSSITRLRSRHAEVGDLDDHALGEQDVARGNVAMHNAYVTANVSTTL